MRQSLTLASTLFSSISLAACALVRAPDPAPAQGQPRLEWGMIVHGGAGNYVRAEHSAQARAEYESGVESALRAGYAILAAGGSSLDAVEAAIVIMEDLPVFNAGKGAVFNHEGVNELDAAIMDGSTMRAGAVAALRRVKNPVRLARAVMERSEHVFLIGEGAEQFARERGIELVDPSYFRTEDSWQELQRALEDERRRDSTRTRGDGTSSASSDAKFGTVGAVALDRNGRIAAATSTGGRTNKRYGRVGDVPVIGAGTYANPRCGVSATGHGEFFIRYTVARDICARMDMRGQSIAAAADAIVLDELVAIGAEGGVIAMDSSGNFAFSINTRGMSRGYVGPDGAPRVMLFK